MNNNTLSSNLERIKDAVDDIRGIVDCQEGTIEEVATAVGNSIQHPAVEKDVNFYDYDGTCLYSYTRSEAMNLEELPPNPIHKGLTAQGWNWTLQKIKDHLDNCYGGLDVGQNYITDDGSTRFYIEVQESNKDIYFKFALNGTATINWGDGSEPESVTGTSTSTMKSNIHHIYSNKGNYTLSLGNIEGSVKFINEGNYGFCVVSYQNSITSPTRGTNKALLRKVELGNNIILAEHCFTDSAIETITIPKSLSIPSFSFYYCTYLECLVVPNNNQTMLPRGVAYGCTNLKKLCFSEKTSVIQYDSYGSISHISIPQGVSTYYLNLIISSYEALNVPTKMFPDIIYFPKSVNNFLLEQTGSYTMYLQVKGLDFRKHTTIPTISSTYGTLYKNNCLFVRVPENLYENWVTASKWNSIASIIIPYNGDTEVPHSKITLAVDSNLSGTTINVAKIIYKLNTSGYTLPSFSDITTTELEENLEWFDGTNTYGFGDTIILNGNITLTLRSKE